MLKSEVEKLVDSWLIGEKYVFITYNWFAFDYVIIKRMREDYFECDKVSTSDMGNFNKDEMIRLIGSNIFIYQPYERNDQDFRALRSQGCDCGSARTTNSDKHAFWCKKYRKD